MRSIAGLWGLRPLFDLLILSLLSSMALGIFGMRFGYGSPKRLTATSGAMTYEPLAMLSFAAAAFLMAVLCIVSTAFIQNTTQRVAGLLSAIVFLAAAYLFYKMSDRICFSWDERGLSNGAKKFMTWSEISYLAYQWGFPYAAISTSGDTIEWTHLGGRKVFVSVLRERRPDLFKN